MKAFFWTVKTVGVVLILSVIPMTAIVMIGGTFVDEPRMYVDRQGNITRCERVMDGVFEEYSCEECLEMKGAWDDWVYYPEVPQNLADNGK